MRSDQQPKGIAPCPASCEGVMLRCWCVFCGTCESHPDHERRCDEKAAAWKPQGIRSL